jgi:hypothetical protein
VLSTTSTFDDHIDFDALEHEYSVNKAIYILKNIDDTRYEYTKIINDISTHIKRQIEHK